VLLWAALDALLTPLVADQDAAPQRTLATLQDWAYGDLRQALA
jgi:hypothetical protein